MSFRIDDILGKTPEKSKPNSISSDSILQQTLQSGYYQPNYNKYNEWCKTGQNWQNIYNFYAEKGMCHYNIYAKSNLWPTAYTPVVPVVFPLQFQHYSKRKGGQVRFTANQTDALEKRFGSHKYLSPEDRRNLAESLKLTDRQVKTWFQNRRAKWRRSNSTDGNDNKDEDDDDDDDETCDSSRE